MTYPQHYLDFIELANAGHFRDALLSLEEVWFEERSEFYAGLLQLMVALNQLGMGMVPERTLRRAGERITPFAPRHKGLDVLYLLGFIEQCQAILPPEGEGNLRGEVPRLQLKLR
jgi:hypothetical protein